MAETRQRMVELLKLADESRARTQEAATRRQQKRKERQALRAAVDQTPSVASPRQEVLAGLDRYLFDSGQTASPVVNSNTVREWFRSEMRRNHGDVTLPPAKEWWTWPEKTLSLRLLRLYGAETVRKAIVWFFENWPELCLRSKGRIHGVPTVRLLWAMRHEVMAEVERGGHRLIPKDKRLVGEWQDAKYAAEPKTKLGW